MIGPSQVQHYVSSDMVETKSLRVLRDLSSRFLTFIIDDAKLYLLTGVEVELIPREKVWEYPKNNKPHIFTTPRPYKIGNNDFTTILGSVNVKNMTPTTICSSNPTENVLGGSIGHTESP